MRYAVLHTIRVGPKVVNRRVRLVITGVPERTERAAMMKVLEDAGRVAEFSEGGYQWGNHDVRDADHLPAGTEDLDTAPVLAWSSMVDTREIKRITLRFQKRDYDLIVMAASQADLRIQGWCEEVLLEAANQQLSRGNRGEQAAGAAQRPARSGTRPHRTTTAGGSRSRRTHADPGDPGKAKPATS